jgi:hypothetical protein
MVDLTVSGPPTPQARELVDAALGRAGLSHAVTVTWVSGPWGIAFEDTARTNVPTVSASALADMLLAWWWGAGGGCC